MMDTQDARVIWLKVITQAIADKNSKWKHSEAVAARKEAAAWFDINNKSFLTVCSMAGVSPVLVLKRAESSKRISTKRIARA